MFSAATLDLLDLPVRGHAALHETLLLEPGADGLQGAIGAAPAVIIEAVLHVVVVAVDPPHQEHLDQVHKFKKRHHQQGSWRLQTESEHILKEGLKMATV